MPKLYHSYVKSKIVKAETEDNIYHLKKVMNLPSFSSLTISCTNIPNTNLAVNFLQSFRD